MPDTRTRCATMSNLVVAYLAEKRWSDAERLLREDLAIRSKTKSDPWIRFHTMSLLGSALVGQGKFAEAEPYVIGGYEGLTATETKIPASRKKDVAAAAAGIAPLYEAWGRKEAAAEWRRKLTSADDVVQSHP